MRVVTDQGAINALATSAELMAVTMKAANAGAQGAKRRARVDTGEMRNAINAKPNGRGARVSSPAAHSVFNEYGTRRMSAQPFMRPSMADVRAAL